MNAIQRTFPATASRGFDVARNAASSLFDAPERGLAVLGVWERRLKTRSALATMEAHLLDDMGLTPEDAQREAAKPFWRA